MNSVQLSSPNHANKSLIESPNLNIQSIIRKNRKISEITSK